ncbi:MAG: arginine--tRNA ligase [Thermoplasmata archaeon]
MTPSASLPSSSGDPWTPFLEEILVGMVTATQAAGAPLPREAIFAQLSLDEGPEGEVSFPCHRCAQSAKRTPDEMATLLAAAFPTSERIRSATSKGAYVNFRIDAQALTRATLELVLSRGNRYGHGEPAGPPAVVEHTSANPTGPFHIGRVRNGIIGDTFARVLRASGTPVTTQYYVDDMGRQAAMITWIWSKPRESWPEPIRKAVDGEEVTGEKADRHRGRPYPAVSAYLKEHEDAREEVAQLVQQIESGTVPPEHRQLAQTILAGMLESLARLGIGFDEFVWESDFVRDGSVERVLERLKSAPHVLQESNGAWAVDASSYGLPKESTHLVFQRGNGTSLYITRDIAYHLVKFSRFARVIDVLGQDHQLHARCLNALLKEIGEARRPEFVIYQDITVPDGGRMSTRGGSAVWLDHLLDEAVDRARTEVLARREDLPDSDVERIAEAVATGAVRYHIVRAAPDKPVVFRWEDALSFEGRSGPFLQYSFARASSVLRKGEAVEPPYPFDPSRLSDPDETALVRIISRFPRTIAYAARTGHVHAVAAYAHELADQFNRFYHAVPVLRSTDERASRIALVAAMRQTLGNALDLLGIVPLDAM